MRFGKIDKECIQQSLFLLCQLFRLIDDEHHVDCGTVRSEITLRICHDTQNLAQAMIKQYLAAVHRNDRCTCSTLSYSYFAGDLNGGIFPVLDNPFSLKMLTTMSSSLCCRARAPSGVILNSTADFYSIREQFYKTTSELHIATLAT